MQENNSDKKINYSSLSKELDQILNKIQSDDLDIDESVELYEKGMAVVKKLEEYLKTTENKIIKIKSNFDET